MASVYRDSTKLPNGKSVQRKTWMMKYRVDGKIVRESSETVNKTEAQKLANERETDGGRGVAVGPQAGKLTLKGGYDNILDDYKLTGQKTSEKLAQMYTAHLEPFFGATSLMTKITPTQIKDYKVQRQEAGAANNTINNELGMLKRMFTLGWQLGALAVNPPVPKLPPGKARRGFYEEGQFIALRERARVYGERYADIADVAYITGWRIDSEIVPLEWRHIDFDGRQLWLDAEMAKNGDGRTFPMTAALEAIFRKWWTVHETAAAAGYICPAVFVRLVATARGGAAATSPKRPVPMKNFYKVWKKVCTEAGTPHLIPHDFRRTAVRNTNRLGVSQAVGMRLSGHKTKSVFDRYNIVSERELDDVRQLLDAARQR